MPDNTLIPSSSYREMQNLLETVNHHVAAERMRIHTSRTKVMSALISGEKRSAVLLDGESLKDV